jgi:hypothetical protein
VLFDKERPSKVVSLPSTALLPNSSNPRVQKRLDLLIDKVKIKMRGLIMI